MPADINISYRQAKNRLLLLDYDGTLVPLAPTPDKAVPTPEMLAILRALSADKHNTVVIVSGRDHQTLDAWMGHLPVALAAEHGHACKLPGGSWRMEDTGDAFWKVPVRDAMEDKVRAYPGSFIEEKTSALVWHYRLASKFADKAAEQLLRDLSPEAERFGLRLLRSHKAIEVQPRGVHKGSIAKEWFGKRSWDFALAGGDDTTDEDLFNALPKTAYTFKIGSSPTIARYTADTPADFLRVLNELYSS